MMRDAAVRTRPRDEHRVPAGPADPAKPALYPAVARPAALAAGRAVVLAGSGAAEPAADLGIRPPGPRTSALQFRSPRVPGRRRPGLRAVCLRAAGAAGLRSAGLRTPGLRAAAAVRLTGRPRFRGL